MSPNTFIHRAKSIGLSTRSGRKQQMLLAAASHNLREIQSEYGAHPGKIDATRTHLNEVLVGPTSAIEVVDKANQLFADIDVDPNSLRKDYTQAIEHVFSLPPGQNEQNFFRFMAGFAQELFGADKVLSFVVHRDQPQLHAHMLVSPISDEKYQGSNLLKPKALKATREQFSHAAKHIGFELIRNTKFRRGKLHDQAVAIIAHLECINHPMLFDPTWPAILEMINSNPQPMFDLLCLDEILIPQTAAQERLRPANARTPRNIAIEHFQAPKQNLSCVGFNRPLSDTATPMPEYKEDAVEQVTRVRDIDLRPEDYDQVTGEFLMPPPQARHTKTASEKWVQEALKNQSSTSVCTPIMPIRLASNMITHTGASDHSSDSFQPNSVDS